MSTTLPQQVRVLPTVLFQELQKESVLLDMQAEQYYSLDDVGTRMWQLLVEHNGMLSDVLAALLAEYKVDESTLRQDLTSWLEVLKKHQLIALVA